MGSVDGDLDCDGATTDLFAIESGNGLLLLSLTTNIDESVTLALAGLSPTTANDAGRDNSDSGLGEQGGKLGIVNSEAEVGNKEHGVGELANGVLTGRAGSTRNLGLANTGDLLGGIRVGSDGSDSLNGGGSRGLSILTFLLGLALEKGNEKLAK